MAQPDDAIAGQLRAIALIEAVIGGDFEANVSLGYGDDQEELASGLLAVAAALLPKTCGSADQALRWLAILRESLIRGGS